MTARSLPAAIPSSDAVRRAQAGLRAIEAELNQIVLNKEEIVRGLLLALATKQHLCILGPPGGGKTKLINALFLRLAVPQFARPVSSLTQPEKLVGPLDIAALTAQPPRLRYDIEGYLPTAWVAFVDEVFRADTLLDELLSMTDEQRLFDHDRQRLPVPLMSLFAAANYLSDSPNTEAMWDRFLFRYLTQRLDDAGLFRMLRNRADRTEECVPVTRLPAEDLQAFQAAVPAVQVPDMILHKLVEIRWNLENEGYTVYDRRVGWAMTAAQAAALLDGRAQVVIGDLRYLTACVWHDPAHIRGIEKIVLRLVAPTVGAAAELFDMAAEVCAKWQASLLQAKTAKQRIDLTADASNDLKSTCKRLADLLAQAQERREPGGDIERYLVQVQGYRKLMNHILVPDPQ